MRDLPAPNARLVAKAGGFIVYGGCSIGRGPAVFFAYTLAALGADLVALPPMSEAEFWGLVA